MCDAIEANALGNGIVPVSEECPLPLFAGVGDVVFDFVVECTARWVDEYNFATFALVATAVMLIF